LSGKRKTPAETQTLKGKSVLESKPSISAGGGKKEMEAPRRNEKLCPKRLSLSNWKEKAQNSLGEERRVEKPKGDSKGDFTKKAASFLIGGEV